MEGFAAGKIGFAGAARGFAVLRAAAVCLLGALVLVSVWAVAVARAAGEDGGVRAHGPDAAYTRAHLPRVPDGVADLMRARERERRARRASASERERRAQSRTAYRDRGRAAEVAAAAHRGLFADALWRPLVLKPGERVSRLLSATVARVVRADGSPSSLVVSTLPLAARDAGGRVGLVDLELSDRGDHFAPANPLVGVEIAKRAAGGVSFGDVGVGVAPVGAEGASEAVLLGGRPFYAEVATDTDMAIEPLPVGAQVAWQLRSRFSPQELALDFVLPAGASLRELDDGSGGAEIVDGDGQMLLAIAPPAAWDADGEPVPAVYALEGSRLAVRVAHRGGDVRYPLAVDPRIIEDFLYWREATEEAPAVEDFLGWSYAETGPFQEYQVDGSGLWIGNWTNESFRKWDYGQWLFWAPLRTDGQQSSAYVHRSEFYSYFDQPTYGDYSSLGYRPAGICGFDGIWSAATQNWEAGAVFDQNGNRLYDSGGPEYLPSNTALRYLCSSGERLDYRTICTDPGCSDLVGNPRNTAVYGLQVIGGPEWEPANGPWTLGFFRRLLAGAAIFLSDREAPTIQTITPPPSGWTAGTSADEVSIRALDPGLGMKLAAITSFSHPSLVMASWREYTDYDNDGQYDEGEGCTGGRHYRCPYQSPVVTADLSELPEGEHTVYGGAHDILSVDNDPRRTEHETLISWDVKIDRSAPEIDVDGDLRRVEGAWISGGLWDVQVRGGDDGAGVERVEVRVDGVPLPGTYAAACEEGGCGALRDFTWDARGAAPGPHSVEAIVTDGAGNQSTDSWQVKLDPNPPSLELSGPLWDARGQTLTQDSYGLGVVAIDDGGAGPDESGMGSIELLIDGWSSDRAFQDCPDDNCAFLHGFEYDNSAVGEGQHTIRVEAVDEAGNVAAEEFTVNDPSASEECQPGVDTTSSGQPCPMSHDHCASGPGAPEDGAAVDGAVSTLAPVVDTVLGDSVATAIDGELVDPTFVREGERFFTEGTRSESGLHENPAAGRSLNGSASDGLCLEPLSASAVAPEGAIVGDDTLVYPHAYRTVDPPIPPPTAGGTPQLAVADEFVRPAPNGFDSYIQIRDEFAPHEFSWRVHSVDGTELVQLDEQTVAVVDPPPEGEDLTLDVAFDQPQGPLPDTGLYDKQLIPDAARQLEAAEYLHRVAQGQMEGTFAILSAPWAKAADGTPVPTTLTANADTVTLQVHADRGEIAGATARGSQSAAAAATSETSYPVTARKSANHIRVLRVLTWNVGLPTEAQTRLLARGISKYRPHVVGLQEVCWIHEYWLADELRDLNIGAWRLFAPTNAAKPCPQVERAGNMALVPYGPGVRFHYPAFLRPHVPGHDADGNPRGQPRRTHKILLGRTRHRPQSNHPSISMLRVFNTHTSQPAAPFHQPCTDGSGGYAYSDGDDDTYPDNHYQSLEKIIRDDASALDAAGNKPAWWVLMGDLNVDMRALQFQTRRDESGEEVLDQDGNPVLNEDWRRDRRLLNPLWVENPFPPEVSTPWCGSSAPGSSLEVVDDVLKDAQGNPRRRATFVPASPNEPRKLDYVMFSRARIRGVGLRRFDRGHMGSDHHGLLGYIGLR